jgi:hypothetical protein
MVEGNAGELHRAVAINAYCDSRRRASAVGHHGLRCVDTKMALELATRILPSASHSSGCRFRQAAGA